MSVAELDVPSTHISPAVAEDSYYRATQWQLIWWAFRRHTLARIGLTVLGVLYFLGILCQFVLLHITLARNGAESWVNHGNRGILRLQERTARVAADRAEAAVVGAARRC